MLAGRGAIARAGATALATALTAATVLATATGTAPSAAATVTTWTVRPGGTITATAGKTTLADTRTGAMIPCASARMSGTLKPGSGLPGAGIGSFATAVYSQCAAGGFEAKLTARGLPWRLNLTSYDRSTGVARGTIGHLKLAVAPSALACTAVINGTSGSTPDGVVPVSYTSKTGVLQVLPAGSGLRWYHVRNCAGIVNNGDPATLSASYVISPRQVITSP
jgi:hypothetical protein